MVPSSMWACSRVVPGLRRPCGENGLLGEGADDVAGAPDEGRGEGFREDADDGGVFAVDAEGAAEDLRVGCKAARPHPVGEDDDTVAAGLVFIGRKETAVQGDDAEEVEEVGAEIDGVDLDCGLVRLGEGERVVGVEADLREGGEGGADIDGVGRSEGVGVGLGRGAEDADEPIALRVREGSEEQDVGEAEGGGAQADAEREGKHGDAGEAGGFDEGAKGESEVGDHGGA